MNRTRIVRWLRVLLPLLALVMLSTLFLFSRKPANEPDIPYSDVGPSDIPLAQRMARLQYSGVTEDGAAVMLSAAHAAPGAGAGDGGAADDLRLTWRAQDGLAAELDAPDASIEDGEIHLAGGVRMTTSSGWILTAPDFFAQMAQSQITAPAQVRGNAPFGDLSAGSMTLTRVEGEHVLNFKDGVRLVYQP